MSLITGDYVLAWLRAFAFTQLVEVPIYMRAARVTAVQGFIASTITHPVLWFVIFPCSSLGWDATTVVGELWVWLVEAVYLRILLRGRASWLRVLAVSLVANAASAGLGELCRWATGYP